jgi:hypothetical protein
MTLKAVDAKECDLPTTERGEFLFVVKAGVTPDVFFIAAEPSLRGLVSAYSQNELNGTTQRCSTFSHARQCGLAVLRMLVMGAPPNCGGPGMPQRASISSRTPSAAFRTIGAG